ncbi:hypothetical protein, partial [Thioclava sp. L04-15]|uniref:hypothetical protein n=1 Tax=Thioclava sp. L04-15 TaxID=1915318 RepID=UPI001AF02150
NLFVVLLMMLHPTQELEPPANMGRFNLGFEVRPLEEFSGKDVENRTQSPKAALDRVRSKEQPNLGTNRNSGPMGGLEVE